MGLFGSKDNVEDLMYNAMSLMENIQFQDGVKRE